MNKLHRIRSSWHRFFFNLCLFWLVVANRFDSRRARVHWIGRYDRPRRPERALFALVFLGSLVAYGSRQYMFWSTLWGGMLSIFLNLWIVYRLIPRKRAHWIS